MTRGAQHPPEAARGVGPSLVVVDHHVGAALDAEAAERGGELRDARERVATAVGSVQSGIAQVALEVHVTCAGEVRLREARLHVWAAARVEERHRVERSRQLRG